MNQNLPGAHLLRCVYNDPNVNVQQFLFIYIFFYSTIKNQTQCVYLRYAHKYVLIVQLVEVELLV